MVFLKAYVFFQAVKAFVNTLLILTEYINKSI